MTDTDGPGSKLAEDLAKIFRLHLPDYEELASVAPAHHLVLSELLKDQLGIFVMLVAYQRAQAGEQGGDTRLVLTDYIGGIERSAINRLPRFETDMEGTLKAIDDLLERARKPRGSESKK